MCRKLQIAVEKYLAIHKIKIYKRLLKGCKYETTRTTHKLYTGNRLKNAITLVIDEGFKNYELSGMEENL